MEKPRTPRKKQPDDPAHRKAEMDTPIENTPPVESIEILRRRLKSLYDSELHFESKPVSCEQLISRSLHQILSGLDHPESAEGCLICNPYQLQSAGWSVDHPKPFVFPFSLLQDQSGQLEVYYRASNDNDHVFEFSDDEKAYIKYSLMHLSNQLNWHFLVKTVTEKEEEARALMHIPPDCTFIADADGIICDLNKPAAQRMKKEIHEIIGTHMFDHLPPEVLESRKKHVEFAKSKKEPVRFQDKLNNRHCDSIVYPVLNKDGDLLRLIVLSRDITDHKQIQIELERQICISKMIGMISFQLLNSRSDQFEEKIKDLLGHIGNFIQTDRCWLFIHKLDFPYRYIEWCSATTPAIDMNRIHINLADYPKSLELFEQGQTIYIHDVNNPAEGFDVDCRMLASIGIKSALAVPVIYSGNLLGIMGCHSISRKTVWSDDIFHLMKIAGDAIANAIQHQLEETTIRNNEEKYRNVVENGSDGICIVQNFKLKFVNQQLLKISGYSREELLEKEFIPFVHLDSLNEVISRHTLFSNEKLDSYRYEVALMHKDGHRIEAELSVSPTLYDENRAALIFIRDLTDKKRLEQEILRSEKLKTMSILASSIAHNLNNQLMPVANDLTKILEKMHRDEPNYRMIKNVDTCIRSTLRHLRSILLFSKETKPSFELINPIDVIYSGVYPAIKGYDVNLSFHLSSDLRKVYVDLNLIQDVIHNIVLNAIQSLKPGGTVSVSAENVYLTHPDDKTKSTGYYVKITIADNGIGISSDDLPHVFDPFFTTKKTGTGIGLPFCRLILNEHHGFISIESQSGIGTTVYIFLPVAFTGEPSPETAVMHDERKENLVDQSIESSIPVTNSRILLLEDEPFVLETLTMLLEELGHSVIGVANEEEALRSCQTALTSGKLFDLVIIDDQIDGMHVGLSIFEKIRQMIPDIKAIISSGDPSENIMVNYRSFGFAGRLAKPYGLDILQKTICHILNINQS